ncbi:hypothetical protein G7011_11970 [Pseudomonas plecoglossicida]|nr:hypothetical protein [Pseudomonas plecoglossicida]RZI84096.1 MAG: hypothetical protein EOP15_18095 [Pseudomonas sp.]
MHCANCMTLHTARGAKSIKCSSC